MVDPGSALLIFAALVAVSMLLFRPRHGVVAWVTQLLRVTERVRAEDALKQLFTGEYYGRPCTVGSLAGVLEVPRRRAAKLVARLRSSELIRVENEHLVLTDAGRKYALRVLRTHRLWERYLAERTSMPPGEWHDEAEHREHTLSPEETEELAARMGHPLFDPHGDPIPTADGELPPQKGVALTALKPGEAGTIVHLEDEPRHVYERLVAAGLGPLAVVHLLDVSPDSVRFKADGRELRFAPDVAANITVSPLPSGAADVGPLASLSTIKPGESATVVRISPACQGPERRRLLDLGLVPGTVVTAELAGIFRQPVAYRIRDALVALRREQADWIFIDRLQATGSS